MIKSLLAENRNSTIRVAIAFLGCCFPLVCTAAQVTQLELNTTTRPPLSTEDQTGFIDRVAKEALARLGIELITIRLPAERALLDANGGMLDGEISRVEGLEGGYPNLIRVPEKLMDLEFTVFSRHIKHVESGWEGLRPYSTAIINGWKILENNIPASAEVTKVKSPTQLFRLLNLDRVDLIIYERWGGVSLINDLEIVDVRPLAPPLLVKGIFMYLNKKHKALVPALSRELRNIKEDGTYKLIYMQTLEPFEEQ